MPQGDHNRIPTVAEAVRDAAAAAAWLGHNQHDQNESHEGDHVLREGARRAFGKDAPPQLKTFLESRGVRL